MTHPRAILVRPVALALGVVLAAWLFLVPSAADEPTPPKEEQPRLVVLVVVDQLRGDYPERWAKLYGKGGFRRLAAEGASFINCHYDYAHTMTAPGHASIVTGCGPNRHGVVGNEWYDRAAGVEITSVENARYRQVPPDPEPPKDDKKRRPEGAWPGRRLQPSVGDVLRRATRGRGKVVSLSIKERSAIMLAGLLADACYWFSSALGSFVTSTYYRDAPHDWVREFNKGRPADQWFGKDWTRLSPDLDYAAWSGPDDGRGESEAYAQGVSFPHAMTGGLKQPGEMFYDAVTCSPQGNDLLLALAKRAIEAEKLGADDVPDLLCLSFSANDMIGHAWGPDSQEVLDATLRTDLLLRDLLDYLDTKVGVGRYAVVLTADHGICPLPDQKIAQGGGRVHPAALWRAADAVLDERFGDGKDKGGWVESVVPPWIYFNREVLGARKVHPADAERALAQWLREQKWVRAAYTRDQLTGPAPPNDPLAEMVRRTYFPERCGEVTIVARPYVLMTTRAKGTTHGSPYPYDTHVPLMAFGPGVRPGAHEERVTPQAAAAILSRFLGIDPPDGAVTPLPDALRR